MSATTTRPNPPAPVESSSTKPKTAKLFKNGRSQAVRLPREFRFEGKEVAIRRDPATGEVVLSQPPARETRSWQEWFEMLDSLEIPEGTFDREVEMPTERDFF